ncbi:MAG TPA: ribonuclease P protein component [Rhizomicrobium sp.]|jgi:ribonuclease P protein component|nr:ribonuclease P protein component [Rhizomicrobium sp.]
MAERSCPPEQAIRAGRPLERLKKRADFLRAARGVRAVTASLSLESCRSPEASDAIRVGYTASRKIGGAVERNRAKRRLRAAAAAELTLSGRAGNDYVLVARPGALTRPYARLREDLAAAIRSVHQKLESAKGRS